MKKYVLIITACIISIIICSGFTKGSKLETIKPELYQYSGRFLTCKEYITETDVIELSKKRNLRITDSQQLVIATPTPTPTIVAKTETPTVTKPEVHTVDYYFNLFPEPLRLAFFADGWVYEKSSESLGQKFYNGTKSVLATTVFNEKHIYIDTRDCANTAILHEVGHAFEYSWRVKGVRSQEFLDLYNAHWEEWYHNYGMNILNYDTPAEGYAQCYEIYMLKPECLDADTRAFIESEIYGISVE